MQPARISILAMRPNDSVLVVMMLVRGRTAVMLRRSRTAKAVLALGHHNGVGVHHA
jgi:hypothetical protein